MQPEQLQKQLEAAFSDAQVMVESDGSHYQVTVVSDQFEGLRAVKKQQMIYAVVNEEIAAGTIHALTIKTYTVEEWRLASKLQVL